MDEEPGLEREEVVTHIATTTILGRPWKVSYMPPCPWYPETVGGRYVVEENLGHATGKLLSRDGLWGITAIGFETPEEAKAWGVEMSDAT